MMIVQITRNRKEKIYIKIMYMRFDKATIVRSDSFAIRFE